MRRVKVSEIGHEPVARQLGLGLLTDYQLVTLLQVAALQLGETAIGNSDDDRASSSNSPS